MYKLELSFDTDTLDDDTINEMCAKADKIFEYEDLACIDRQLGKRTYLDRGRKQDYGRFWAALFRLKDDLGLSVHLKECIWYNGTSKENLIPEFLRY